MPVYLGGPNQVQLPADHVDWTHNQHTWIDWQGVEWDLSGGTSGVVLLDGVRGIGMPVVQAFKATPAGLHGSRWRGMNVPERDVFWPIELFEDAGSQAWIDHDARWWATLHPERVGLWKVTQPSGVYRTLTCRFVDDGQKAYDVAPELVGWVDYSIALVAEDPFWYGQPELRLWGPEDEQNYYGGTGGGGFGPPYFISSGSSASSATIPNPGDVEAWPTWTVYGPATSATVGIGSELIEVPITLADETEWVRIDTSPYAGETSQRAIDQDGVDRTLELGTVDFAAIPPAAEAVLNVTLVGGGQVEGRIVPAYLRAS